MCVQIYQIELLSYPIMLNLFLLDPESTLETNLDFFFFTFLTFNRNFESKSDLQHVKKNLGTFDVLCMG